MHFFQFLPIIEIQIPVLQKQTRCETCKMHFLSFQRLERHVKQTHDAKEFKCRDLTCVDSFETQQLLDAHIATKHKRVECPICKKSFVENGLAAHIRKRHEKSQSVCCELCGKVSSDKQMHKYHCDSVHKVVQRLQCDICGQWYE